MVETQLPAITGYYTLASGAYERICMTRQYTAHKRSVTPPPPPSSRSSSSRRLAFLIAVLFAASATTAAAQSDNCVAYNTSSSAGNLWDATIAHPTYFTCAEDGFIVAVESTSNSSVNPLDGLSWTCSGGDVIGSLSSDAVAEDSVSFTVAIAQVKTKVEDLEAFPYLGDMSIGGYDIDADGAGVSFSWKGPLGDFDDDDVALPGTSSSSCGNDSFATGVTVWSSTKFVYGVVLECADVTTTCTPPNYPASLIQDDDDAGSGSAADAKTLTPSPSAAFAANPPNAYGETVPSTATPSPSVSAGPTTDTPNPSASTVVSTNTPGPSENTAATTTHTPSPSTSTMTTSNTPSPSEGTVATTNRPSFPGGMEGPAAGTPSPSASSTSDGGDDAAPTSPATSVSSGESSTSSVSPMVIVGASVAGGLFFLAVCVGAACCFLRRDERKMRQPVAPRDTFGTPAAAAGGQQRDGARTYIRGGDVTHVTRASAVGPVPARDLPPPYSDHPRYYPA